MAKKKKVEIKKTEREYVIPLREKCRSVPRYKKTNKAVKTVKEFLVKHMKIYDRDLRKIKIDRHLNEYLWFRGIRSPPHKVKVKVIKEGDIVKAVNAEKPDKIKCTKASEEKRETKSKQALDITKTTLQKAKKSMQKPKEDKEEKEEKKEEEKEKKSAVVEQGEKQQKQQAKKEKHMTQPKAGKQMHREQKIMSK